MALSPLPLRWRMREHFVDVSENTLDRLALRRKRGSGKRAILSGHGPSYNTMKRIKGLDPGLCFTIMGIVRCIPKKGEETEMGMGDDHLDGEFIGKGERKVFLELSVENKENAKRFVALLRC